MLYKEYSIELVCKPEQGKEAMVIYSMEVKNHDKTGVVEAVDVRWEVAWKAKVRLV
jgi:hypothetical protein